MEEIVSQQSPFEIGTPISIHKVEFSVSLQLILRKLGKEGPFFAAGLWFEHIIGLRILDEMIPVDLEASVGNLGPFVLVNNSRWISSLQDRAPFIDKIWGEPKHYLIVGQDQSVEVISGASPEWRQHAKIETS